MSPLPAPDRSRPTITPAGRRRKRPAARLTAFLALVAAALILSACGSAPVPSTIAAVPSTIASSASSPTPAVTSTAASPTAGASNPIADLPGQIVFVDEQSAPNHAQIWIQNANGTNLRPLVTSSFDDRTPRISPDGTRVLFTRYVPDGAPLDSGGVFVVNIDGTGLRHIDDTDGEDPSWSPDGRQLVETRDLFDAGATTPYNIGLWIRNLDGTGARQVTRKGLRCAQSPCPDGYQDNRARWSPDGKTLLFARDVYTTPEHHEIVTASVDGSHVKIVTGAGMEADDPAWSRDGQLILFQSPPDPGNIEQNLYTIKPDGTGLTKLTSHLSTDAGGVDGVFHPSWSPDGSLIVFSHYPGASGRGASLYVIKADGTGMELVTEKQFDANDADWGVLPAP